MPVRASRGGRGSAAGALGRGMAIFAAEDPIGAPFRGAVGDTLRGFITAQTGRMIGIGDRAGLLSELALAFTAGGKRLRPAFCW